MSEVVEMLKNVINRLNALENRISRIEKGVQDLETLSSRVILRPTQGQPIVPSVLKELFPDAKMEAMYSIADTEVDVSPIMNDSLAVTLETVYMLIEKGQEVTAEKVAKKLKKSRSTASGRLNMLSRLGLLKKTRGRTNKYTITEKGNKMLGIE